MKETDCRKCCVSDFKDALCKKEFCEKYYHEGRAEDFEKLLMHWIPVTERLPEESGLYIVTNIGRWVEPVGTRYYNIRADGGFWSGHPGDKVLAWIPLPEPYKEGHDERE